MLTSKMIINLLEDLNSELTKLKVTGELGLCGGAVMCLVFKTRCATKDIDGIFAPTAEMRKAIAQVAEHKNLPNDWLNAAAKGFFSETPPKEDVLNFSNLRVWAPSAEYMLAMKCISARYDTYDKDDLIFLIKHLNLVSAENVFEIILKYYPNNIIPVKTKFFIEKLFQNILG